MAVGRSGSRVAQKDMIGSIIVFVTSLLALVLACSYGRLMAFT